MKPLHAVLLLAAAAVLVALIWDGAAPSAEVGVADLPAPEPGPGLRGADGLEAGGPALESPAAVAAGPARGSLHVVVLGVSGKPITTPYVSLRGTGHGGAALSKALPVNGNGAVRFEDVPYDGSVKLEFWRSNPYAAPNSTVWSKLPAKDGGSNELVVTGPEAVFRARTGIAWRVEIVAAETGVPVEDAYVRSRAGRRAADNPWLPAPHTWLSTTEVGRNLPWGFDVQAPRHMVVWELTGVWRKISPFARVIRQVHPVRREMAVTLHPEAAEGGAVAAKLTRIEVAGSHARALSWKRDAHGRLNIRGVPFLRNELIHMDVSRENGNGAATFTARIPDEAFGRVELPVILTDDEPFEGPANNGTIGIGGSSSSRFRHRTAPPDNHLEVRVLRRDGTPAADVEVKTRWKRTRTNAEGIAHLRGVMAGEVSVQVRQPGLLPLDRTVTMPKTGKASVVLREGLGGIIDLEVVDAAGRPLSFAQVDVTTPSKVPWVDLEGATQRIDPFTDHLGRRTLRHVEPGTIKLRVGWGSRTKRLDVVVKPGETTRARVVLPMRGASR